MTTTFTGEVRIPGSIENGLPSTITLDAQTLVLTAGGTELGRWNRSDLKLRREPDGSFHLTLGREVVLFNPDSPLEFAILSGMPGVGTAPAPAPAPADPPATPTEPAPATPPAAPAQPAATPPQPVAPTPQPSPVAPPPVQPQPGVTPPPAPATAPEPVASASTPPPSASTPPLAAPQPAPAPVTPQPAAVPPAATAPAATAAPAPVQPTAPATAIPPAAVPPIVAASPTTAPQPTAPAPATPPPTAPPADIQLEQAQAAPAPVVPEAPAAQQPQEAATQDFWDGFHEDQGAASELPASPSPPTAEAAASAGAAAASGFDLETDLDDSGTSEETRVGGYGSGLFSEDDDRPVRPPAFSGDDGSAEEDRAWSYYEGDKEEEDPGWSYDDPDPQEETAKEEAPAFRSPVADREDLVGSSMGSKIAAIAGWRPSLPSFSMGSSELGMRARNALSVLDAILEENGTDDIPRSFIIGLGGLAAFLGLVAVLVVLFG